MVGRQRLKSAAVLRTRPSRMPPPSAAILLGRPDPYPPSPPSEWTHIAIHGTTRGAREVCFGCTAGYGGGGGGEAGGVGCKAASAQKADHALELRVCV